MAEAKNAIDLEEQGWYGNGESSSSSSHYVKPHEVVSVETKNHLRKEALTAKRFFDEFEAEFTEGKANSFYIISEKWLSEWKKHVSFENIIKGMDPENKFFGQSKPGSMNTDIVEDHPNLFKLPSYPKTQTFSNVLLKQGLQEGKDYRLVTHATWDFFFKTYGGITVKRPCHTFDNGQRQVEVRLKQLQVIAISWQVFKRIEFQEVNKFDIVTFQVSSQQKLSEFKSNLVDIYNSGIGKKWFDPTNSFGYTEPIAEHHLSLWKLDPTVPLNKLFFDVKSVCRNTIGYDYKMQFPGVSIQKGYEVTMEEAEVADSDYIFVDLKEGMKEFIFTDGKSVMVKQCDFCNSYKELPFACACEEVAYCSERCKTLDRKYHEGKCPKAGEEEKEQIQGLKLGSSSRRGLCGLQNLGNTCFMNSGLQCLSNIPELTEYFLSGKYEKEINEANPLGTQGKLVRSFSGFLKNLWFGTSSVYSPWSLKQAISKFQNSFSGYQQHDSQELLAFLLDGLHEDLNRVQKKPTTEVIESENQPDEEVGFKSWENHLKRNQSHIVDLMHGQYKSQITCPSCNRISITFDPFSSVSLPIPTQSEKKINLLFVCADSKKQPKKLTIPFQVDTHTAAKLREDISKALNINPATFVFALSNLRSLQMLSSKEDKISTSLLRKRSKMSNSFYAFEVDNKDSQDYSFVTFFPTRKRVSFHHATRLEFSFRRIMSLHKNSTARDIYLAIFKKFRVLWDQIIPEDKKEEWNQLSNAAAFDKVWSKEEEKKKPFQILLKTNARIFTPCFFCGEKRCDNCELKIDSSVTLAELESMIKDDDFQLEFEVFFDELPAEIDTEVLSQPEEEKKEETIDTKSNNISIYQCFNQFEESETLGEENAWYCSKCKDFQKATKKMVIYKAPPILMLHLKRFKSGGSFLSKSKISDQIDFPLENLDISEFVLNHDLPTDYPVEKITPVYKNDPSFTETQGNGTIEEEVKENGHTSPILSESSSPQKANGTGKSELLYDLLAVVNHYGGLGSGHYTAYGKNCLNKKWYCFDDSSVSEEDPKAVCSTASYVLFYKRKNWTFKP